MERYVVLAAAAGAALKHLYCHELQDQQLHPQPGPALGVTVKPSGRKGKKIAIYKNGQKVADVGALGYCDFPCWRQRERAGAVPAGTADARRRAYKARHKADRKRKGSPGWWADQLLW